MKNLDLLVVVGLVFLQCVLLLTGITGIIRFISGFMFVSFLPGYVSLAAFYRPHLEEWDVLEHSLLSVPVSLAINAILGLVLNTLSLSTQPESHLLWGSLFICSMAWLARGSHSGKQDDNKRYLFVTGGLVGAVLLVAVFASVTLSKGTQEVVSLYLLNADGQAERYPNAITLGEPLRVIVGGHYEGATEQEFELVSSTGAQIPLTLQPGEEWRKEVQVTLQNNGPQNVSWSLQEPGTDEPLRLVQLWLDVE